MHACHRNRQVAVSQQGRGYAKNEYIQTLISMGCITDGFPTLSLRRRFNALQAFDRAIKQGKISDLVRILIKILISFSLSGQIRYAK